MGYAVVSLVVKPRVVIPISRVRFPYFCPNAKIAQLVEHRSEESGVVGSIPTLGTNFM